ncbi:MAG: dihydropteroate synthase [Pseudomonas sp.]
MQAGDRIIDLSIPKVMGILNTTPDSFSDGGRLQSGDGRGGFRVSVDKALSAAEAMVSAGAAIIDVGGESTRPGAAVVSGQEEVDRVVPVVAAIRERLDVLISVDTSTPRVISESLAAGAGLINDVRALTVPGALEAVANGSAAVCLMHMRGQPRTMQEEIVYDDVVGEVYSFLQQRMRDCEAAGIAAERIVLDPGFGFGKTVMHNYQLLAGLGRFQTLQAPLLVGISRKSMIGQVVERPVKERLAGTLAATVYALQAGASIIRTQDVGATLDVIRIHGAMAGVHSK